MEKTTTDNGFRSVCCYAPIRVGKKKLKQTKRTVNIWICCKCQKRDVNIIEYSKDGVPKSTSFIVDDERDEVVELEDE